MLLRSTALVYKVHYGFIFYLRLFIVLFIETVCGVEIQVYARGHMFDVEVKP